MVSGKVYALALFLKGVRSPPHDENLKRGTITTLEKGLDRSVEAASTVRAGAAAASGAGG